MAGTIKNLRFQSVTVQILSIENTSRVLIRWAIEPTTQNLTNVRFFVDRGESPNAMVSIEHDGLSAYGLQEFVDYGASLQDLHKIYYYRVRAVEFYQGVPLQEFVSQSTSWGGNLDLTGIYITEEHLFKHRWVTGVPVMIFKKKHDGAHCIECWDNVLKRVTKSNCTTCFGTGKMGGYYPPIEDWVTIGPSPKNVQMSGEQNFLIQPNQTMIEMTSYPELRPDDLVIELKPDLIWKVLPISTPEKNRTALLQYVTVSTVNRSDIEHKIPVPEERRKILVAQLDDRIRTEKEY